MTPPSTSSPQSPLRLNILGCRGVPAAHGGFETFAARLAPYLVRHGWDVTVYCQEDVAEGTPAKPYVDKWQGVTRRHIFAHRGGPAGTIEFDLKATLDVLKHGGIDLVLGYNTGIFALLNRMRRRKVLMNMDGIEWKRAKWSWVAKTWFYLNERAGANLSQVSIADHPEIAVHLRRRGRRDAVVIPYGAEKIVTADAGLLERFGIEADQYFISIARVEPENSILEIVQAFSARPRNAKLVILGKLDSSIPYHASVMAAAGDGVILPGPIYEAEVLAALRLFALAYVHGHQVGGTNPSLVEALGASNAVIAHDNRFNRWTAGEGQFYFSTVEECDEHMSRLIADAPLVTRARACARTRFENDFEWEHVLGQYRGLLEDVVRGVPVKSAY
jgi:glycosyltransferase involved in cell wall biosynthesis